MKKWIFFPVFIILFSCKGNLPETFLTHDKAAAYFKKVEEICNRDNGKLWGNNLYGPMMFVDRTSRQIIANQPDKDGNLKLKDGVYIGNYPREKIINNTAMEFGGTLFGIAPLPPQEDEYRIVTRAIHCLFHRYQYLNGILPANFNSTNMDEREARIWLKLEWKALRKAINSEGEDKLIAIRDALIFRGTNQMAFPGYVDEGNRFETYEGLASFTYTLLPSESMEAFKRRLFESLDRIYSFQSYSQSYGSILGALYATLLYQKGFDFKNILNDKEDLGLLVMKEYDIELPEVCRDVAGSLSISYNLDEIYREEEKRLQDIKERLYKQISIFNEKPVVFFDLESPYFDFEPEDVHSLDTLGTLYSHIRVSDNWGKLTVNRHGCLISDNYKQLRITAKGLKIDRNHVYGEGWQMILNETWVIEEVDQNYFVRRISP
ncbi:MAG: hypothetical protein GYA41_06775 [Bacteroidales bacterium]|nr:hypothetical protein [Bacteroidales bacterium]